VKNRRPVGSSFTSLKPAVRRRTKHSVAFKKDMERWFGRVGHAKLSGFLALLWLGGATLAIAQKATLVDWETPVANGLAYKPSGLATDNGGNVYALTFTYSGAGSTYNILRYTFTGTVSSSDPAVVFTPVGHTYTASREPIPFRLRRRRWVRKV
jgi:hypothetical protein